MPTDGNRTTDPKDRERNRPLRYRLLTGPDDRSFCERVSQALEEGYELHGSPAIAMSGDRVVVAQAVILRYEEDADDADGSTHP
jgi:hypothetical protein